MMNKLSFYLVILIFATLPGCAVSPGIKEYLPTIVNTATIFNTDSTLVPASPNGRETLTPTERPPALETAAPPAATLTFQEPAWLTQDCFQMVSTPPDDSEIRGKILLIGDWIYGPNGKADSYEQLTAYNIQIRNKESIPPDKFLTVDVSPDGKYYAVQDYPDRKTLVYSYEGKLINVIPQGSTPWHSDRWLDNKTIVFNIVKPFFTYIYYPRDVVMVNAFTNQQRLFPSEKYPDIDLADARLAWEGGGTTQYDANLTRVIYPGSITVGNSERAPIVGYILWDLINKKKLADIATYNFSFTPKWSLDQSEFIVNNLMEGDFYLVTRDGEVSKITNFNPDRENKVWYSSSRYSWSPDGKHVALWLELEKADRSVSASLVLLTVGSGELRDTCISAGILKGGGDVYSLFEKDVPIWSPDGQYLAIRANRTADEGADVLLVDLKKKLYYKIEEDLSPVGWLYGGD
jgi:hypothetical protein